MTAEEQRQKCNNCMYMKPINGGKYRGRIFKFRGCFYKHYKGKWCAELIMCPKEEKRITTEEWMMLFD